MENKSKKIQQLVKIYTKGHPTFYKILSNYLINFQTQHNEIPYLSLMQSFKYYQKNKPLIKSHFSFEDFKSILDSNPFNFNIEEIIQDKIQESIFQAQTNQILNNISKKYRHLINSETKE